MHVKELGWTDIYNLFVRKISLLFGVGEGFIDTSLTTTSSCRFWNKRTGLWFVPTSYVHKRHPCKFCLWWALRRTLVWNHSPWQNEQLDSYHKASIILAPHLHITHQNRAHVSLDFWTSYIQTCCRTVWDTWDHKGLRIVQNTASHSHDLKVSTRIFRVSSCVVVGTIESNDRKFHRELSIIIVVIY